MANKWAVLGYPNAKRIDVIASYNKEIRDAQARLESLGVPALKLKLPNTLPTSGKQAYNRVQELKKINPNNIRVHTETENLIANITSTDTRVVDIFNPSKYLFYQDKLTKKIKGHTFSKDYKMLTSKELKTILKEQNRVNEIRKRQNLPEISGFRFNKEKTYKEILNQIKIKGTENDMRKEKERFVNGIITALTSALGMGLDTGTYTDETNISILRLIARIKATSLDENYRKLWTIYEESNNKELYNMFASDSTNFQIGEMVSKLFVDYDIIDYTVELESDYGLF